WQQVHLLSAEIWCDFKTVNGGIEPFLNSASENTLLFIPEDETARNYIKEYNLRIVAAKEGFYLLSH
ncbi:MAG: hypothetical protein Q8930_19190, partial [Bacillota bacterium]|nr:hypothetical protein [Bacillota bacterium]